MQKIRDHPKMVSNKRVLEQHLTVVNLIYLFQTSLTLNGKNLNREDSVQ